MLWTKAYFAHDAANTDSRDVVKRTVSDKIVKERASEIALNPKCDAYQRGPVSMVYMFFEKKIKSGRRATSKTRANVNEVLAQILHKPLIKEFKRRKVYWRFGGNIWTTDLAEMKSVSSKNPSVKYLCVIDVFTMYPWVKPFTEKSETVLNGFIGIANGSKHKLNILWIDKGKEFHNNLMQKWLYNSILMYSTYIEGKSVDAERFIRTLKGNIYKKMTANNIKSYPGYLNKSVAEYNNNL